ncbi:MAG: histidinol-phosphatase [Anaeroplasmataceae bacterium]
MFTNYHTHTFRCGHAVADIEDYVIEAIKQKIEVLGFSDHGYLEGYELNNMDKEDFSSYLNEFKRCKEKYKDKIELFLGLEMDFFPNMINYYKELLNHVDYLTASVHYINYMPNEYSQRKYACYNNNDEEGLETYYSLLSQASESGLFKFINHIDMNLIGNHYNSTYEKYLIKFLEVCKKNNTILELNANGIEKGIMYSNGQNVYMYPRIDVWKQVKKYDLRVIINRDAHNPKYLNDNDLKSVKEIAYKLDLNIIDKLDITHKV